MTSTSSLASVICKGDGEITPTVFSCPVAALDNRGVVTKEEDSLKVILESKFLVQSTLMFPLC